MENNRKTTRRQLLAAGMGVTTMAQRASQAEPSGQNRVSARAKQAAPTRAKLLNCLGGAWPTRMPTYAAMERTDLIHCFPNYIPGWRQYGDIPDIVGMIAPRALHLNFGEFDAGSPIEEVRAGMETIRKAYQAKGGEDKFTYYLEPGAGHILSDEMLRRVKEHFDKYLKA